MRSALLSPTALFVAGALALTVAIGVVAARSNASAGEEDVKLPTDATSFGFVVRSTANGGVPLLEATKTFDLALANGPVHGARPGAAQLTAASNILTRELARYPAPFVKKIRLAGIVLTDGLTESDSPIPSLPNVGGLLLIDASSAESDLVRCFHHEIFHFIDLIDDGTVAPDATWEALNAKSFVYGSGGRTLRGSWASRPSSETPGFISAYGTSAVEEDKADMFAFAVARPAITKDRAGSDAIVRAKVIELERRVNLVDPDASRRLGLDALTRE